MSNELRYIDLFAGAGGLSEGFIKQGYEPVAHVEMDSLACDTLKTRLAYHYLKKQKRVDDYYSYLKGKITRDELWARVPEEIINSVINEEITDKTLRKVFKKINQLLDGEKVDVIIGGPPCQAYSLVGRSRDPKRMEGDQRNYLFKFYGRFLKRYRPKFFVFENVLGLLTAGNKTYFNDMITLFEELGYSVDYQVLNAEEYGVLQRRRRVFIVGRRGKRKFSFPILDKVENTWQVKQDLFSDLPNLKPGQEMHIAKYKKPTNDYLSKTEIRNGIAFTTQHIARPHNERDLKIYGLAIERWTKKGERLKYTDVPEKLQTHKNTSAFLDRYKVVDPEGHSHTMVAHIAKDGHYYIYPDKRQIRSISVREAARIQSFPDDFYFEGGRTAAFKQIGNAVPPLLAEVVAKELKY